MDETAEMGGKMKSLAQTNNISPTGSVRIFQSISRSDMTTG